MIRLRTAPLCWLALGLIAGILLADVWKVSVRWWLLGAALMIALLVVTLRTARSYQHAALLWPVLLVGGMLCTGAARYRLQVAPSPSFPIDTLAIALAQIEKSPTATSYGWRFTARTRRLLIGSDTLVVHVLLDVRLRADSLPGLHCGDQVLLGGRLETLRSPHNPGWPDRTRQAHRQGIAARLQVDDLQMVAVLSSTPCFSARLAPLRAAIAQALKRYVPLPEARGVVQALLLGDRSGLSPEVRDQLGRAGLAHLLAISGLHVMLVGLLLYGLLRPLLLRLGFSWHVMEPARTLLTLALLSGYVLVASAPASAVRALVMTGLFLGATLFQTPLHPFNTLGAAALLLLLIDPSQLFEPGFQLSFAAVAGLLLGWMPQRHLPALFRHHFVPRYLSETILVTLTATLATAPFMLYHFGYVSLAGLLSNLPGIPLAAGALAGGLLTAVAAPLYPPLADLSGHAAALCAHLLLKLGAASVQLFRPLVLHVPDPPGWVLLIPLALLSLIGISSPARRRLGLIFLGGISVSLWLTPPPLPYVDVLFFDVGHGDAALIRTSSGRTMLIDTGGRQQEDAAIRWSVLPFLRRYGIDRLDAVLVTHPDADHAGGLPLLLRQLNVARLFDNGARDSSALSQEIAHLVDSLHLPRRSLQAGDTIHLAPALVLQVLAPTPGTDDLPDNERSVVLRMVFGQTRWLFLGDAESRLEQQLVEAYGALLQSDVVKVAHHGSRTSSTPALVRQVIPDSTRPAWAVISSGWRGVSNVVRARWKHQGARLWITAESGALWLRSDGQRIWPVRWQTPQ